MNRKIIADNMIWRFLERSGAQGVTFVVSIFLARLLDPETYGIVALAMVLINILQVFIDCGLGNSLIQKKDVDDADFSTVFFFNLFFCMIFYMILFFFAPLMSQFYSMPILTKMVRVLGVTIIISAIKNIQQAYVARNLLFRKFFFSTLSGTIGAGVIGIWMAFRGYGVWALITQYMFNLIIDTSILWITVKWRPKCIFSFKKLGILWSYAWKLLLSGLLDKGYMELRTFVIGKIYTTDDLAFYERGRQFPAVITTNINTSIDSVLLPSMSSAQDDIIRLKAMTRRAIMTSTYVMAPLMMGLAVCATSIVRLILTEKWLPCVFFLRIVCLSYMFYPIHTANLNAIKAVGRSDLFLYLEIIKKIVDLSIFFSTVFISVKVMAVCGIISSVLSQIINSWPNKKLLDYSYLEQIRDILPNLGVALLMAILVYPIQYIGFSDFITLLIQIPLGMIIYFVFSKLFRLESCDYLLGLIKSYFSKSTL